MGKVYSLFLTVCMSFSFFLASASCDVYSAGHIDGPSAVCSGESFLMWSEEDPSTNGTAEYLWLVSYDGENLNNNDTYFTSTPFAYFTLTESAHIRRCVRPEGCGWGWNQALESEWEYVDVSSQTQYTIHNEGSCDVDIYWWVSTGDEYYTTLHAGESWEVTTYIGHMWRAVAPNWNINAYDEHDTVDSCDDSWTIYPEYCAQPCGSLDGIYIYDQYSDAAVYGPIQNGDDIELSSLPSNYYLVAQTSGNVESVTWLVNNYPNTENIELYTYPLGADDNNSWNAGAGSYSLVVNAFNQDNGEGDNCGTLYISFDITNGCDNITHAGSIDGPSTACYNEEVYISSTELPSGGSGAIEYIWLFNPNSTNTNDAIVVSGANGPSYGFTPTESGWYRRCARRAGCEIYSGETNWVHIQAEACDDCDNIVLDQWNNTSSCQICYDGFTSTISDSYNGAYGDEISFQDPLCSDECITGVTIIFNVAAADFELDQNANYVNQLDINYPIELNGQIIGHFDPTELPYTCNLCEPEATRTVHFDIDPNSFDWNYGGTNELDLNFYEFGNANNTFQDVCVANVELAFDTEPCSGLNGPTDPTCDSGSFLWENSVDVSTLSGGSGIPQADVRFIDGQITQFVIPGPYPTEFNSAVTVSIDEAISWDGYLNRVNVTQNFEQWKVVFKKDGNVVYESAYTQDVPDQELSGEWIGALDSDIFLPEGTDEIVLVHIEDPQLGDGSFSSANSVVPTSICISYDQTCALEVVCEFNIDHEGWHVVDNCTTEVCPGQKVQFSTPGCDDNLSITVTGPNGFNQTEIGGCHNFTISEEITPAEGGTYTVTITDLTTDCSVSQDITVTVLDNVGPCAVLLPPTDPTCNSGSFLWENSVDITTLSGGSGIPQADVRFIDGQITQFVIPGPYPSEFNSAVAVSIDEAISWDGYLNRVNVTQNFEQWKVVFKKDGNVVYESAYTEDVPDQQLSGEWIGSLDSDIFLPNGTDEIVLVHIEDDELGAGSFSSANSVVPSSICISYTESCLLEADAGDDVTICEGQEVMLTASAMNASECADCCERTVSNTMNCSNGIEYAIYFTNDGPNHFVGSNLSWSECENGTATYSGSASNGEDNLTFDIVFTGGTNSAPAGSPKNNNCTSVDDSDWTYYTGTSGTVVSEHHGTFHVVRRGEAMQVGNNANQTGLGFGASGWLDIIPGPGYDGYYNVGDVNFMLSETCTASASNGSELSYLWSNGETTPSITVTESGVYSVVITDCLGCVAMDEVEVTILDPQAGTLTIDTAELCADNNGCATATATANGDKNIPAGYTELYVLTSGSDLVIVQLGDLPEFTVCEAGDYTIHTLVYPEGTDLSGVELGVTTGVEVNALLVQGGGDLCASLDVAGAPFTVVELVSIGDFVWEDTNGDGCQDPSEEGVEGVELTLRVCEEDSNGNQVPSGGVVATTTSGENGEYNFDVCFEPNTFYTITASNIPSGFELSPKNNCTDNSSDSDANPDGTTDCFEVTEDGNTNVDFGITGLPNIGDTVFYDDNRDGIQDVDEDGVEGVTVELVSAGDDGVFGTADDVVEDTQITDANGNYLFEDVIPGEYKITFSDLPADYVFSPADQGGDDALDSDANEMGMTEPFTVVSGQDDDLTFDAGINLPTASLGDTVFEDEDQDGIQDPEEGGIEGVEVTLYACDGTELDSTETDENGNYIFEGLEPNESYYVVFGQPEGYEPSPQDAGGDDTADSDANEDGQTECVELGPDEDNEDLDAGFYIPTNVGDTVFYDDNRDGIQDADEDGVEGVTVELVSAGDDGIFGTADDVVEDTQVTDENGNYLFEEVLAGDYIVVFSDLPEDYVFSPADQGGDDAADSDAGEDGATEPFTVTYGQDDDLTFDAGINLPTASLGDTVFEDEDQDGIQDPEEGGIEGVEVTLYLCDGTELASTETDENGNYIFEGLEPNESYYVVFGQPEGYEPSPQDQGGDDTADSDANADGQTECVELAPDEDNEDLDAGFYIPTNVGDTVFFDNDRDGIQDADEDGVEGVTVELVSAGDDGVFGTADDVVEDTQVTDANGNYLFEEVLAGDYIILFSDLPEDYVFSPADQGGDDAADSDAGEDGATEPFTVTYGQDDDLTIDAGINLPTASLGDTVFEDEDQDGIQDPEEGGIEGVEVTLYACDGTELASTETDENGNYIFEGLEPNESYYVVFGQPEGYEPSPQDQGGDDTADSDANADGQTECVELGPDEDNEDLDAGFYIPTNVGDTVFYDDNRDGIQDADEDGVEGVTVELVSAGDDGIFGTADDVVEDTQVTDENGNYLFEEVLAGDYIVVFSDLPADYVFSPADQGGDDAADSDAGEDGATEPFTVTYGQDDDLTIDAGINLPTASLGDTVFEDEDQDGIQDPEEGGIEGVEVTLYACDGTELASTETDENGNYIFEGLEPNESYYVVFGQPEGYEPSPQDQGGDDTADSDANADGQTECVELAPDEDNEDLDAGFYIPTNVGDTVFYDDNRDGIQDAGEEGVEGVTVELVSAGDDGVFGTADDVVEDIQVTDANGNYLFEEVLAGDYIVVFSDLPADYVFSPADQGGDDAADSDAGEDGATEPFTVTYGQDDDLTIDAGINLPTASLGDTVFEDEDQDGIQDPEEGGIEGVEVTLYACDGTELASTETDENGNYIFEGLEPNESYYVVFGQPEGYEPSPQDQGGDDTADSDANADGQTECVELAPDEDNEDLDAGFYIPTNVGDTVFYDDNRDGIQDAGEEGVEGVTVELVSAGDDGVFGTADDVVEDTQVTDANGNYLFEEVLAGDYIVVFSDLPADYVFSPADQGGDDAADSDAGEDGATEPFTVTYGQDDDLTIDAGINLPTASLGDTVFEDEDQDGIQDPEEGGIEGVEVTLYACDGTELASTETDENGNYIFEGLEPNESYYVVFGQPEGYEPSPQDQGGDDTADSDANEDGQTECVELAPDEDNEDLDAGFYIPTNVGDTVFEDTDLDGIQDAGEEGVEGVTVELVSAGDDGVFGTADDVVEDTQVTDENGNYLFEEVLAGDYIIIFSDIPEGTVISPQDQGGDDAADSDAGEDGVTEPFTVTYGQEDDLTIDAGIYVPTNIGDTVFEDTNLDGIQDAGEEGVEGITVELVSAGDDGIFGTADDVVEDTQVTDENGNYLFEDVLAGDYIVVFSDLPEDFVFSPQDQGGDDDNDSDAGENGSTEPFTVTYGQDDDLTIDAGIYIPTNVGDTVFEDTNLDGIQDAGEEGVEGVTVELVSAGDDGIFGTADDVVEDTQVTDENGNYLFEDVVAGDYVVIFSDIPEGTVLSPQDQGGDDALDSDAGEDGVTEPFTVSYGQDDDLTIDAGIYVPTNVGDTVFFDEDVDGIQDADEDGVEGVTVELVSAGDDGIFGTADDVVEATDVTDENGNYLFEDVLAGDYIVVFSDLPDGFVFTNSNQGGDDTLDSDADVNGSTNPFTVTYGQDDDLTIDAGVLPCTTPTVNVEPEDVVYLCQDGAPAAPELEFSDLLEGELTVEFTEEIEDLDCGEVITRTWTVTNYCGNTLIVDQILESEDNEAPVVVSATPSQTIECSDEIPAIEVVFEDNCTNELTVVVTTENVQDGCNYAIVKTCVATDNCGNSTTQVTTITIVDTTAPVLFGVPANETIECDETPADAIVTATDNCDEELTVSLSTTSNMLDCGGTMTRTWTVADDCGNTTTQSQVITFVDTTAPVTAVQPEDVTIECGDELPVYTPEWSDNCDDELEVSAASSVAVLDACTEAISQSWTAVDNCGNTTTVSRTITIEDTTAPVITCPADLTHECDEQPDYGVATATDNCNDVTITSADVTTGDDCLTVIERTWTATDACGNASTCVQTITIEDTTAPVITCPADLTHECDEQPDYGVATATDNCNDVTITSADVTTGDDCLTVIERTWTATDACGNASTCVQTITIEDTTAPVITCPADLTHECDEQPDYGVATATDNCNDVTITSADVTTGDDCLTVIERTWTATDACGNASTCVQTITIEDTTAPVITCPADLTHECDEQPDYGVSTATDNCNDVTITSADVTTGDDCLTVIERTWTATDACGNASTCVQTITIEDTTAPVITCPADLTHECDEQPDYGVATATDNCNDVTITSADVTTGDECLTVIERTWTATDACGNASTCVQTITIEDTTAPVITCPADLTHECDEQPDYGVATATDNCNDVTITSADVTTGDECLTVIERTWTATDACGNASTCVQTITIEDTTAPVITCPADLTHECDEQPDYGVATATDNCNDVTITSADVTTGDECLTVIERTWTATDACGNASTCVQTITIEDTTAPVITCPADLTHECDEQPDYGVATATDNCNDVTITSADVTTGDECLTVIERTWTATDACGNASTCVQTITIEDTTAPVITCPADLTHECDEQPDYGVATATDNCNDVTITSADVTTGDDCLTVIERTWTATDACGNASTCVQTITIEDTTAPVITCPADLTHECDEQPDYGVATATDNCNDVTITSADVTTGDECLTVIERTWTATDACGNASTCVQTITIEDTTAPVITCPADLTHECDEQPDYGVATATDNCNDVTITSADVTTGDDCLTVIERTWTATDACGNASTCVQTITIEDTTAPVITCPADLTHECDEQPDYGVATATDNCNDVTITSADVTTGDECLTVIERTWTATDACGNASTCVQTITIEDTTAPVITCPADLTHECDEQPDYGVATATDNCNDVTITSADVTTGDECLTVIERTWTATDACGNASTCVQTITIEDTTAPVITCPADLTHECDEQPDYGVATATDNCNDVTITSADVTTGDDCLTVIERTWTATDACGNASTCVQTITIEDTTAPVITCPADLTHECDEQPDYGVATATDNCNDVTITSADVTTGDECLTVIERTWTATDACGNASTCVQTITIEDTTAPVITCPADLTHECDEQPDYGVATATDNCNDVTITSADVTTGDDCLTVIERTWTATDACGNASTCVQTITIEDTTAPVITCPADLTHECDEQPDYGVATATDNCNDVTITSADVTTGDECLTVIERTWTATDACGNASTCVQTITIEDTTAPVITCPADLTHECDEQPDYGVATATDNCNDVTITSADVTTGDDCLTVIERTWTATDACGNASTCVQTITIEDTTAPVITCPADLTHECDEQPDYGVATATDNCNDVTITSADVTTGDECLTVIERTWTATDACGNASTCVQTITIEDTTAPVITCPADLTHECDEQPDYGVATATDNCNDVTITSADVTTGDDCLTVIERTWTATDACGNASTCVQTITIEDTTAPVITCPADLTHECDEQPDYGVATATDNCNDITITSADVTTGDECETVIERTWTATDACGNASTCVQTITIEDTTAPVITCPADLTHECDEQPDYGVATATDNCNDVTITSADVTTGDECLTVIERTWTATDACGNASTCVQTITIEDTTAPVITCPADLTHECDEQPDYGVATATDNCNDVTITSADVTTGDDCLTVIERTWTATDACGNASTCVQTITIEDTTAPVITCPADLTHECDEQPDYGVATATDNCNDVTITSADVTTGDECLTVIERTWTATDACGNASTCVQTITIEDTTAPVITCPADLTHECDEQPDYGVATATDNCNDVTITSADVTTGDDCLTVIERTWTATDACGNASTCVQTITIEDTTAPVITCPADLTHECDEQPDYGVATATDNCNDVTITSADVTTGDDCLTVIERTWTATDACGNASTCVQTITIEDTTAPVITCPADLTHECDEQPDYGVATATDNCNDVTITSADVTTGDDCLTVIERTWTATDACGNASTCVQTITIEDTTAPVITCPADLTHECDEQPDYGVATATDNCNDVTITSADVTTGDECLTVIERTWTATDACGNASTCVQTITIEDTTAPVITCPADLTHECDEQPDYGVATATDNCNDVTITSADVTTGDDCLTVIERTWTATDACGNASTCVQTITIEDTTAPVITCPADLTHECDEQPDYGVATATDNCNDVTITSADVTTGDDCLTVIERTWTATDACGNASTCVQTITIEDTTAPVITCPADLTHECDEQPDYGVATATDNCNDVTITSADVTTGDECLTVIERTWTATDACGNASTCVQTITIEDTTAPVITCPADLTHECDEQPDYGVATATDNCNDVTITSADVTTGDDCLTVIERTWTATDACGNASTCVQTITIEDTTAPVITCPADLTHECDEQPDYGVATATDNCNDVTITSADVTTGDDCLTVIERTWTATDACGNASTCVQTITIEDTTAPVITCPADLTHECDEQPDYGVATATDNCNDVTITSADVTTGDECLTVIERTWTATDACGNASTCVQTITIEDTTAPVITCPADLTHECDEQPDYGVATATDNCNDVTITSADVTTGDDCLTVIERTWTATDACGNASTCVQTITIEDTTAPVITCPADLTHECDEQPDYGVATATDNCNDVTITSADVTTGDECLTVIERTWTATDACGNASTCVQTITIEDTTAPVITCPADLTHECDEQPDYGVATATDNCNDVTITSADVTTGDDCLTVIERTWTATDACGNASTCVQTITIEDTTAPVITCPADLTHECDEQPDYGVATATDNCNDITITSADVTTGDECETVIERTWTATDACGNASTCVQTITIVDTTAPVLTLPADINQECDEEEEFGMATATDNCTDVTVTFADTEEVDACTRVITRTWTATDACDNTTSGVQTITIVDTTAPVLFGVPADETIECDETPSDAIVTATDNCDEELTVALDVQTVEEECGGSIIRTWTVSDDCGNTTEMTQTITLVDTTAPVVAVQPEDVTIECGDAQPVYTPEWSDNCDAELETTEASSIDASDICALVITQSWTATDNCDNTTTVSRTITIVDTTAPVITCPADVSHECDSPVDYGQATAIDVCDDDVTITFEDEASADPCQTGFTRTWTATDACGNASTCVQTITIEDTTAPVITCPADLTHECDEQPDYGVATATDNCNDVTITSADVTTGDECETVIERTWTATDACGNASTCVQTITIVDTTAPVLTLPADISQECDEEEEFGMATATDNCTDVTVTFADTEEVDACTRVITRTWTATDACDNTTSGVQTITIVDTTAPVLFGVPADETIECDETPSDAIVTATDNCDEELIVSLDVQTVEEECGGSIIRTWTVSDDCGNTTEMTQTITLVDTTAPVITCPADVQDECNSTADFGMATAEDNCNAVTITSEDTVSGDDCETIITRTWTATDACGNASSCVQTITLIDSTSPELTVPADLLHECDEDVAYGEATAEDDCNSVTVTFEDTVSGDACETIITRTWTATDECGNATSDVQTITIVDTTAPVLTLPADLLLECNEIADYGVATAEDNCNEVTVTSSDVETGDACETIITRTWTATDACGNNTSGVQTITIVDTTAPELFGVPADAIVECDNIPAPATVTAADNCDQAVEIEYTETEEPNGCELIITRTWRAVDECANQTIATQTLTVVDTTAPEISEAPADETVECNAIPEPVIITATDTCDDDVEITYTEVYSDGCPYTITRTWTATDDCGNTSTTEQIITVIDEEAPVFVNLEVEVDVNCEEIDNYMVEATDNCDSDVEITFEDTNFSGGCFGVIQRTWTATDECGNSTSAIQFIRQLDDVDPILLGVPADITLDCEDEIPAPAADVTATDNCASDVLITFDEVQSNEFCPYTITRTWTAQDECGNIVEGVQVITVEVEVPEFVNIFSYPNPANNEFTVQFSIPTDKDVDACIFDALGKAVSPVFKGQADGQRLYEFNISASDWESGMYILSLMVGDEVHHHKILINQTR